MTTITERVGRAWRPSPVTLWVTGATALVGAVQLAHPAVLHLLQRDPDALHSGQDWRLVSPVLVQSSGWTQYAFNLTGSLLVGVAVEPYWGRTRWVGAYLAGGVAGILATYYWEPHGTGGGSSDAVAALIGMLVVSLWSDRQPPWWPGYLYAGYFISYLAVLDAVGPLPAMVVGSVGAAALMTLWRQGRYRGLRTGLTVFTVAGAAAMIAMHDSHGVGLTVGVGLGLLLRAGRRARGRA
ncbi:rhomboid family intramembrane serine protease [Streptacidiphilus sp. EB129]|uniref:rhomboid family intramembrane serine protease n=1 Tax=Streptacidiphilus sp. EB129 TaxID=3156262 RepID=UPI003511285B